MMTKFIKIQNISCFVILGSLFIHYALAAKTPSTWKPNINFPPYGIIHNSTITSEQKIALGVNQHGNLNTPVGTGTDGVGGNNTKTLNTNYSDPTTVSDPGSAPGAVGIAYYWEGCGPSAPYLSKCAGSNSKVYKGGWYDGTSPGARWEGWGAGAIDNRSAKAYGFAFFGSEDPVVDLPNMVLKSFVVDATSIKSTVWILDTSGDPMLEVTHLYGPTVGATNKYLFQALVTITNISGGTLNDVRYRRIMDWDILENTGNVSVDHYGVAASAGGSTPRAFDVCDNGGSTNLIGNNFGSNYRGRDLTAQNPNPFLQCEKIVSSVNADIIPPAGKSSPSKNLGSSFNFQFGNLPCNDSATFYIYYGAASSKSELSTAFGNVGASIYSLGYDSAYPTLVYGFGFKGVSGTGVAPTLPTKIASLPAGSSTDSQVWQTYAPPILGDGKIYQALFKYQKEKQWIGEIKRYKLEDNGAISSDPPLLASDKLKQRAIGSGSYATGGRSIWSVGYDPLCKNSIPLRNDAVNNSFNLANSSALQNLLFGCSQTPDPNAVNVTNELISFVRGLNSNGEEFAAKSAARSSVLGDTYHSEMVMVGIPNAPWSSDTAFEKSEAYYRATNKYDAFIESQSGRDSLIYVGANDGMLHAFDLDLDERWAFIPPSVIPMLRNMIGSSGNATNGGDGKSNSIFSLDGPITVKDVYFEKEKTWKTVLMGGLGWGGNSYYALDITNPNEPSHLFTVSNDVPNKVINYWDKAGTKSTIPYNANCSNFDYSKLGGAWSRPAIMLLPYSDASQDRRWVAVFGGGYAGGASVSGVDSISSFGAYAYVVDLEPDSSKKPVSCGATSVDSVSSSGGHVLTKVALSPDGASTIPNGVTAHLSVVTGDGTSMAKYYGGIAYFTDLQGQLWKFNLSKSSLTDDNVSSGLFSIGKAFRSEATLANDRMGFNQLGSTIVSESKVGTPSTSRLFNYFGTGDQTRLQRRSSDIVNRIYGVSDPIFPATGLAVSNQTVSLPNAFTDISKDSCTVNNSWYADVAKTQGASGDSEKIVGRAAVYNKFIYFSAYRPETLSCPLYGQSRLIEVGNSCQTGGGGGFIGEGLATSPAVDGKGNIYVGMSNLRPGKEVVSGRDNIAKLKSSNASSTGKVQYKSWREKRVY